MKSKNNNLEDLNSNRYDTEAVQLDKKTLHDLYTLIEDLIKEVEFKKIRMLNNPISKFVIDYWHTEDRLKNLTKRFETLAKKEQVFSEETINLLEDYIEVDKLKLNQYKMKKENKIKDFANKFNLVFVTNDTCSLCNEFSLILKKFSDYYKFDMEIEVSKDVPLFIKNIRINTLPTLIAVKKNGENIIKISEGFTTFIDLERYIEHTIEYNSKFLRQ